MHRRLTISCRRPLHEQHRIVAKIEELFSDLDAGVAALKRAKANLKRYRAAVLKAAVEGKLTEEWRAKNPPKEPAAKLLERILKERRKKWEEDQLAAYEANGKQPPKNWRDKYQEPAGPDTANLPALPEGWCWAAVEQLGDVQLGTAAFSEASHRPTHAAIPPSRQCLRGSDRHFRRDGDEFHARRIRNLPAPVGDVVLNEAKAWN